MTVEDNAESRDKDLVLNKHADFFKYVKAVPSDNLVSLTNIVWTNAYGSLYERVYLFDKSNKLNHACGGTPL